HGPWLLSMDGLRDVSPRQKTLRNAIGWSYGMLTPTEQTLFTRLAVFVGGCTLEAAEMLCGADAAPSPSLPFSLSPPQVLDGIASLLDKSLLQRETSLHGEPRYVMLETVREYGLERVALSGHEAALRARHVSCFLRLIDEAEQTGLEIGFFQVRYLIDDDIHNVRAALAWTKERDIQGALLLAASLLDWLYIRGPYAEGKRLMDEVFALPGASIPTIPRAKALSRAGLVMYAAHEDSKAQACEEESLVLSRELGYGKGEADALLYLGYMAFWRWHDLDAAQHYLERSVASYRTLGNSGGVAFALFFLAEIPLWRADFSQARALIEECLIVAEQAGFRFSYPLSILAWIAFGEGDLDRARALNEQRLAMEQQRREVGVDLSTLNDLVRIATRQGDFRAAHAFVDRILARTQQFGSDDDTALCECYLLLAMLVQAEGDYGSAVWWYRAGLRGMKYLGYYWKLWSLGLAGLAGALEQHQLAARLLGTTEALEEANYRLWPIERNDYNRLAGVTRASLGAAAFDAAWMQGRAAAFEAVIEEAVSALEGVLRVADQPLSA
ncbi:MAG: hypothetical protein WBR35_00505, partial [Anaerolineae bacterium]